MPLTSALQARLKKRGIITSGGERALHPQTSASGSSPPAEEGRGESGAGQAEKAASASGCPNQWNPHHECSAYCAERWGGSGAEVRGWGAS